MAIFPRLALYLYVLSLQFLSDMRVQWTELFDDACLDALCGVGPIKCLDCLGGRVAGRRAVRFLSLKVHDDALRARRRGCWSGSTRGTAGPRERRRSAPGGQFAAVEVVVWGHGSATAAAGVLAY